MSATPEKKTPALRFPEFEGEWTEKRLGDFAVFSKGKGVAKSDIVEAGRTPCIRYGELYTEYGEIIDDVVSSTNIQASKLVLSEENDVIIPASGETAIDIATASCVMHSGIALGGDLNIVKSKENGIFLAYFLSGPKRINVARLAQGNSVVHLYGGQLSSLLFYMPPQPEQKKIVVFLAAVDKKLAKLRRKRDFLTDYKRGVMQQIFFQQIRFKADGGSNFPDWEEKKLGEVVDVLGGGTPDTMASDYWGGDINWFTPTEIKSKYLYESKRKLSQAGLKNSSAKLLPIGALLLSTRATVGDVGIAQKECATNQGFQSLITRKKNVTEFWYYWVLSHKKEFFRRAAGSTFLEIGKSEVQKIPILTPHPDEQKKIANFLSAIDTKIDAVAGQISQMEAFKKGLFQQMFV